MIDDAYNRYAFNDVSTPRWFADEEDQHNVPQLPITKAEVEEMKARFKVINARPIKKVAEAKARKKLRERKKLQKMQAEAAKIAATAGMSELEKIRSIQRLYKKLGKQTKPQTVYIVRQKGGGSKGPTAGKHAKVKIVDRRMKRDKKSQERARWRQEHGRKTKRRKLNTHKKRHH